MSNLNDIIGGLQGTGYGTYSYSSEGLELNGNGGVQFTNIPLDLNDHDKSWSVMYKIKNNKNATEAKGHQIAFQFGEHLYNYAFMMYSPAFINNYNSDRFCHCFGGYGAGVYDLIITDLGETFNCNIFREEKVVWDAEEQRYRLYMNNILLGTSAVISSFLTLSSSLNIGAGIANGKLINDYLYGIIRHVRIYDRVV
jgi:hypothetical protein